MIFKMKLFSNILFLLLVVVFLNVVFPSFITNNEYIILPNTDDRLKIVEQNALQAFTFQTPIRIDGNDDFDTQAIGEGWSGDGTAINPYIIKDYFINGTIGHGVIIQNTDRYFELSNIWANGSTGIDSTTGGFSACGFFFRNVSNGLVLDSIASYSTFNGFYILGNSKSITFTNISSSNNGQGIIIFVSSQISIIDSRINDNDQSGFEIQNSDNITLNRNHVENNEGTGMSISSAVNDTIINNFLINNSGRGIFLSQGGGNPNNLIIENNNALNNGDDGFYFSNLRDQSFKSNLAENNSKNGVAFFACQKNIITDNNFTLNRHAGLLLFLSDNNTITSNNFSVNDQKGISFFDSDFNNLTHNLIRQNYITGISLELGSMNWITNNTATSNYNGVLINNSNSNLLENNLLTKNVLGTYIVNLSDSNIIRANTFLNNIIFNARDDSFGLNYWETNGYSDYTTGIIYYIPGGAGRIDFTALPISDIDPPTLNRPADIVYEEGTQFHTIIWIAVDPNPFSYLIYKNNTPIENNQWQNDISIIFEIDNLPAGFYNYTIIVFDINKNFVTDEVFVTVTPLQSQSTTTGSITQTETQTTTSILTTTEGPASVGFMLILTVITLIGLSVSYKRRK